MPMSLINEAFAAISKKGQRVRNLINLTSLAKLYSKSFIVQSYCTHITLIHIVLHKHKIYLKKNSMQ